MKLIVFGATGTLGRHAVAQALRQGYRVTAFARNPSALNLEHERLRPVAADVLDKDAVARAVSAQDAVLITLGAGFRGGVRTAGTRHVVEAMRAHRVRRLVCLSTLGAGDSRGHLNFFWKYLMFGLLLRQAMQDHEAQETLVRNSGLDWVIVRPAAFTDGQATGDYRLLSADPCPGLRLKIARADVAGFMLRALTDNRYLHLSPGLSY